MLFSKRPSELTREDIQRVVRENVPEGSEVEFKGALPAKRDSVEPWAAGEGRIGDYARDKLLAEVVAFANAYGGWLLVGIEETNQKPARAAALSPVRACAELAERLRLMCRDCIDPRLPPLEVEGVEMQEDGAGAVVFHVPRSRMAPHRLTPTRRCYRRHGDRTEEMDMREIQDLTLQVERGMAAVDSRFNERQEEFAAGFDKFKAGNVQTIFGIRATLVPLTPIYIDRVHGNDAVRPPQHELLCTVRGSSYKIFILQSTGTWRPIIRGSISRESGEAYSLSREIHCDGLIEYLFMARATEPVEQPLRLAVVWVMGVFCNAICAAEMFRQAAGTPDVEYGLEFEIANKGPGDLNVASYPGRDPLGGWLGPFPKGDTLFPRYSIGPREEFRHLAQVFERDFWDAVGHGPSSLAEVDFERAFRELGLIAGASRS